VVFAQAIFSSVMTIFFYAIVIAAVWKLFQIATDLGEIKTILADIRRAAGKPVAPPQAGPISLESAEALLREVGAESHAQAAGEHPKTTA
jgi:hypothetical protein